MALAGGVQAAKARGWAAFAALGSLSCTLVLQREGQCTGHGDCQALNPNYVCSGEGVCVSLDPGVRTVSAPAGSDCRSDAECADGSVCRDGFCRPIEGEEGRCVLLKGSSAPLADAPDLLLIGLLSSADELGLPRTTSLDRPSQPAHGVAAAVSTALAELNRARQDSSLAELPPVAGVACNENDPNALEYLLDDLRIRLIVGPTNPERVELAVLRAQQQAILLPPFADGPNLVPDASASSGWLLSCRPNRSAVQEYFLPMVAVARRYIEAVVDPAPLNPALLVSRDVATASFAEGIDVAELDRAGVRRFDYGDLRDGGLVSALATAEPPVDLVIAASSEDDWGKRMAEYDAAYFEAHGRYPYYLLANKRARDLEPTLADADTEPARYLRFLGLDYARSSFSRAAQAAFADSYREQMQRSPEPALEYAYDCTYLAIYSAVAAGFRLRRRVVDLSAEAILTGLGALRAGGVPLLVGAIDAPKVVAALAEQRGLDGAIDLIGASGELELQLAGSDGSVAASSARRYFSPTPPNGEIYCADAIDHSICDTGIVLDVGSDTPTGSEGLCACLRDP